MSSVTREDLDAAKVDVHKCEDEIESIKRALGRFALGPQDDISQPNQLDIAMLKWQGLPEELAPTPAVTLQLSSPVEEIRLDRLWDPLDTHTGADAASDEATTTVATTTPSKSVASFSGVETSMATLTMTVHANPTTTTTSSSTTTTTTATGSSSNVDHHQPHHPDPLGSSESIDVSLWCPLDAMNPQESYQTEWPVTITKTPTPTLATAEASSSSHSEEGVEERKADTEDAQPADETTTTTTTTTSTLGTVTLRVTYKPSAKDQQEALYELLNKASQRKSLALEHLRQVSLQLSRAPGSADARSSAAGGKKPAVKPGFLNTPTNKKQQAAAQPNRFYQWYQATLGPQSLVRFIFPVAKNYIIFFTAVVLLHYKGQELALPAPV